MKAMRTGVMLVVLLGYGGLASAGNIDGTPITVVCGMTIKVTDDSGSVLTLDRTDPIFAAPCPKDGITIKNSGKGAADRGFTVECAVVGFGQPNHGLTITGSKKGTGIELVGPGLSVLNCSINGFTDGITANGDAATVQNNAVAGSADDGITVKGNGSTIQDNRVVRSKGDGFAVTDSRGIKDDEASENTLLGNRALDNGGWGFNLKGNRMTVGLNDFSGNNTADNNGAGGFLVKGEGSSLTGLGASNNKGPGIQVTSSSCCTAGVGSGQALTGARAVFNFGPGILYSAKADGDSCPDPQGPDCLPIGYEPGDGANDGYGSGDCPKRSVRFDAGVCLIVQGVCTDAAKDKCP